MIGLRVLQVSSPNGKATTSAVGHFDSYQVNFLGDAKADTIAKKIVPHHILV
jgi:hypothetical protein